MDIETLKAFLLWSGLLNLAMLTFWFLALAVARDKAYRIHSKLCRVSEEQFNGAHYTGMMLYKLAIFLFNLGPYLALSLAGT